jgi:hypothetical protein
MSGQDNINKAILNVLQNQNISSVKILSCLVEIAKLNGVIEDEESPLMKHIYEFVKSTETQVSLMTELINKYQDHTGN